MSSETPSHPNYKLHKKLMRRRAIRESWPLLVWLGVAALGVWAYQTGGEFNRMRGIVSKPVETISAGFTGRLVSLPEGVDAMLDANGSYATLEQGLFVEAGKVVAHLDDGLLKAEIEAEKQKGAFDRAKLQQELQVSVSEFQDRIPQLEIEQQRVEEEIKGQEKLKASVEREVKSGLKPQSAVEEVQAKIDALTAEFAAKRLQIEQTTKLVQASIDSITNLQDQVNMGDGENAVLNLLQEKVNRSVIRTTSSGFIDKIYARPGSVVKAGDPIMDIVVKEAKMITAMIPEAYSLSMKQGDTVYIAIPNNRKEYVTATVTSLQQSLMQIPDYGSPIRGRMVRGRLVEFGNLGGNDEESQLPLLPGSEVVVSLKPPGRIPFLSWFSE